MRVLELFLIFHTILSFHPNLYRKSIVPIIGLFFATGLDLPSMVATTLKEKVKAMLVESSAYFRENLFTIFLKLRDFHINLSFRGFLQIHENS